MLVSEYLTIYVIAHRKFEICKRYILFRFRPIFTGKMARIERLKKAKSIDLALCLVIFLAYLSFSENEELKYT